MEDLMGAHIDKDGKFQSDKYPTCPAGKVPLSITDKTAQPLLWAYAQLHREIDAEFSDDLEAALRGAGYEPASAELNAQRREAVREVVCQAWCLMDDSCENAQTGEITIDKDSLGNLSNAMDALEALLPDDEGQNPGSRAVVLFWPPVAAE
jgi:hypothetical protein